MTESSARPFLPTSSTDFALPPSSSSSNVSSPGSLVVSADDTNPLLLRFRRPSILAPKAAYFSETRLQSPLVASFTLPSRRIDSLNGEESESDRDRMWTDSSPSSSSENPTPPLGPAIEVDAGKECGSKERGSKGKRRRNPSTPPRHLSPRVVDGLERLTRSHSRRPSGPLKPPRILNLLQESRPEENEVKSEAAFQRLILSVSELPMQPRTPRAVSDRGRYPEEAGNEESQREETLSDDESNEGSTFAFLPNSESVNMVKPCTPANSANGDEMSMLVSESPGGPMDVDIPMVSPSIANAPVPQWRYTPPPTTSAVRSNKRKFDDRFDPYPTSSKRRAVSPSISYFREAHGSIHTRNPGTPRLSIPTAVPVSTVSSATSSPTITSSYPTSSIPIARNGNIGHMSVSSSPTMRSSMGLASPVMRSVPRTRRGDGEEREVEGAGAAVEGLTLD